MDLPLMDMPASGAQHLQRVITWMLLQARKSTNSFLVEVEAAWGIAFKPGYNPDLTFMAHRWEPLR